MEKPEEQLGYRRLGKLPLEVIEGAIADALSEVAGGPFDASVRKLDLEPTGSAALLDEYELILRVKRRPSEIAVASLHRVRKGLYNHPRRYPTDR